MRELGCQAYRFDQLLGRHHWMPIVRRDRVGFIRVHQRSLAAAAGNVVTPAVTAAGGRACEYVQSDPVSYL